MFSISRLHFKVSLLFVSILSVFFFMNVQAQEAMTTTTTTSTPNTITVEKNVIVSPSPKSANCTTVSAHWEGNIWVDTQTICKYENRSEGVAWVQDYWACTVYNATTGDCTTWEYRPGHWVKVLP